jgi:hypothetical protein
MNAEAEEAGEASVMMSVSVRRGTGRGSRWATDAALAACEVL